MVHDCTGPVQNLSWTDYQRFYAWNSVGVLYQNNIGQEILVTWPPDLLDP